MAASRYFHDSVLQQDLEVNSIECAIIDTVFYQSLRRLQQLGVVSRVYHNAESTRFGHSLQVMECSTQLWNQLARNQPDIKELHDQKWLKRLRLSALVHDLGHGPFSHLFDDFIQCLPEEDKPVKEMRKHEDRGILLLRHIVKSKAEITEEDLHWISCMIRGQYEPWQGMSEENLPSAFLFEILANNFSGMDCDKIYLRSDSNSTLGLQCQLQFDRIFRHTRIKPAQNPAERHLIFSEHVAQNLVNVFMLRRQMHKDVYQNHTVVKLKVMMHEILLGLYLKLNWRDLLNNYAINNHHWRRVLTDDVISQLDSIYYDNPNFSKECTLWQRIQERKLVSLHLESAETIRVKDEKEEEQQHLRIKYSYSSGNINIGESIQLYKDKNNLL